MKAQLRDKLPGGVDLAVENPDGSSTSVNIVPQQDSKRQKTRAGFCGYDGSQFCNRPWPTGLLGPIPTAPVSIPTIDLETCGQSCQSNDECGGPSDWNSGCRCVIPKTGYISDPVFPSLPVGRCLVLTAAMLSQSGSLFGKRELSPSIGNGLDPFQNGRVDLEKRDLSQSSLANQIDLKKLNLTDLSNLNLTELTNLANLTDFSDADEANVTFVQSANQSIFAEFYSDDYNDLPSLTEAIDNENPPANLTSWVNETSLEAYTSLNTLPSYVWCACNCTYISWGCCGPNIQNGIVQEPASYNKGHIGNCTLTNGTGSTSNTNSSLHMESGLSNNDTASQQMGSDQSSNNTASSQQMGSNASSNAAAISAPAATVSVAQDLSLSSSASSTSSPAPRPTVCTTKCRSAVRACEWWCTCQAPPVGLFFWFQGACGPRYKKRSLPPSPSFFDEEDLKLGGSSSDPDHVRRRNSVHLSTNSTARQLLGLDLPANAIQRPAPGGQSGGSLFGNKVTMQMIPNAPYPAPCNESYISYACADSTDGIVYEPPEMWLGALLPDDDASPSVLPPAPERWLQINGLDDNFNQLNKVVS